jgi:D-alanyl-D-alanine carboxypeptidase
MLNVTAGTTEYGGGRPLSTSSRWQIGSNTKAFTSAMILRLEAERALSINDSVGKWLPQYPAWRAITIKKLLNMTSGIASYDEQPAFLKQYAAAPETAIPIAHLIAFANGIPLQSGYNYTNTAYLLAHLIAEKAGHAAYADQLERRFVRPLALGDIDFHTDFNPPSLNRRMPAGYFFDRTIPQFAPLLGKDVRPTSVSWQQGAGGIVATTQALTLWVRALGADGFSRRRSKRNLRTSSRCGAERRSGRRRRPIRTASV